ncbi:GNAT family N-acetyltransferase [Salirhabdus salicampi]|uniref:GNAT family N-acetyltransferase n=1 Tax=Salirhabdus salicampi TaxID=476102 RepID=UPI0020C3D4D2|nr:GNAT family N-acetyltransferase [Salirhabdus salicampi]MCP8616637.1 GNAT family N-acetyltransferase [Salirhabdus salicampi]
MRITTDRMEIQALSLEDANTLIRNKELFFQKQKAAFHNSWPHHGLRALLPLYIEHFKYDKTILGFGPWVIWNPKRDVIGDIGFKGVPVRGAVEIGYYINPEHRKLGYATEAVGSLTKWALGQTDVCVIFAQCDIRNQASQKVLEHNDYVQTKIEDDIVFYQKCAEIRNCTST